MAALRAAQAANWKNMDGEAVKLVAVVLAGPNTLPDRYADYSKGLQSYLLGHAGSAGAKLERALDADSEWSEVWAILGET